MDQSIDEGHLRELMVQSQDLHSDAMKHGRVALDDYVDAAIDAQTNTAAEQVSVAGRSRRGLLGTVLGAGAAGVALFGGARAAFAASSTDVQALQTAAGIENLAVNTYKTALTLPYIGGSSANAVVKTFAQKTMQQHQEHGQAFNAAVVKLGGQQQTKPDPKYGAIVAKAVPTFRGPADVVGLAVTLEDVAAQTYVKNVGLVSTADLRQLFASVAGVEAQHRAILLSVQALLAANAANLIALPPDAAKLPAVAGKVGIPDTFYPTAKAVPVSEGAVK
jgi:hypothetical protein